MVLFVNFLFHLTLFFHLCHSTSQTVGIRTCDKNRASALGTSFIRFHGSESKNFWKETLRSSKHLDFLGFSGWFEWNGSKTRGEYEEVSFNTDVGITSGMAAIFKTDKTLLASPRLPPSNLFFFRCYHCFFKHSIGRYFSLPFCVSLYIHVSCSVWCISEVNFSLYLSVSVVA